LRRAVNGVIRRAPTPLGRPGISRPPPLAAAHAPAGSDNNSPSNKVLVVGTSDVTCHVMPLQCPPRLARNDDGAEFFTAPSPCLCPEHAACPDERFTAEFPMHIRRRRTSLHSNEATYSERQKTRHCSHPRHDCYTGGGGGEGRRAALRPHRRSVTALRRSEQEATADRGRTSGK
jgi:hypothetical protein